MTEADRLAIANQLGRLARILDGRRRGEVHGVFHDDVGFNYGDGREPPGIEALRLQFSEYLDACGPSQHLLGSLIFEAAGAGAVVTRCYVQARHQGSSARSDRFLATNGEYVDRWERESGRLEGRPARRQLGGARGATPPSSRATEEAGS